MRYESLTAPQRRAYMDTVTGSHHRRIEIVLLTLDGKPVRDLTESFLGGSIQGDVDRTPVEVCDVDVLDVDEHLDWSNGRQRHFKLRVIDSRFVPALDEWVEAVVFTGPVWDFDRQGDVVSLVAQGSERLAMGSLRNVFHRPRKTKATSVIRDLLAAAGAQPQDRRIPSQQARLPESVTIGVNRGKKKEDKRKRRILRATPVEDTYWQTAAEIAEAIDRELYSDGRGRFVLGPATTRPAAWVAGEVLLSPVTEKRVDAAEWPNTWLVVGANPKGPKPQVQVQVQLPPKHPASADSMAWHGKPRDVTVRIENSHLRTKQQARRLGQKYRDRAMRELTEYEVNTLPVVPWLRPNATITAPTSRGRVQVRVRQWTLPLGPGADPLTIGANRRRGYQR